MSPPIDSKQSVRRVDAPYFRILDITGADAARFMQSQFCNDQEQLSLSRALLNGYCTPKGRLLAIFVAWASDQGYRALVPDDIVDGLVKRLRMFVLRDDVTITPRDDLGVDGVIGSDGTSATESNPLAVADDTFGVSRMAGCEILRWPSALDAPLRAVVVGTSDARDVCLGQRPAEQGEAAEHAWRAGDIAAGIPWIRAATSDAFVPQMVNLQKLDGLSFKKGCYPGQEIVARMQYLGKLKREMRRFRGSGQTVPGIGDSLPVGDDADAGQVVDAVPVGDGFELLAVVKRQYADDFTWQGAPLETQPLPYALEDADTDAGTG